MDDDNIMKQNNLVSYSQKKNERNKTMDTKS